MTRKKGNEKNVLEEACRLAREAAKNGGKAEGWPESEEEKKVLAHRIFYLSFVANGMFLVDEEKRMPQ